MTAKAVLRAVDGQTLPQLAAEMKAKLADAADDAVKALGIEAQRLISDEGHRFHVRARKTRKPVRLGARLSKTTANRRIVEGSPVGFWSIIEKGSKFHRIERKLLGKGKNKHAQLLRTPYGPRPYVLHPGHGPVGHPWAKAMVRVQAIPQKVVDPAIVKAFKGVWK